MKEYAMNNAERHMGDEMKYTNNKQIHEAIKDECRSQGKTLAEVAKTLGMLPQTLSGVLTKKHISFDDVQRIADALGCDLYFGIVKR